MKVLFYTEADYMIFEVPTEYLSELHKFARENEIGDDVTDLYTRFVANSKFIEGAPTSSIDVAFLTAMNGLRKIPTDMSAQISEYLSNPMQDHIICGGIAYTKVSKKHFIMASLDLTKFEEQANLHKSFPTISAYTEVGFC